MAKLFDRVGQATATTGTGTVTLGSVITDSTNGDLCTFADMGAVAGDGVNYLLVDGNNFEIGTGTLGGTGPGFTLTRTVAKSKIAGTVGTTALTLSGTAKVYCSAFARTANAWANPLVILQGGSGYNAGLQFGYGSGDGIGSSLGYIWTSVGPAPALGVGNDHIVLSDGSLSTDLKLYRDAAQTLAQKNTTNPQTFRVYGSDGGANYSRLSISHAGGTAGATIATEAGGTGTAGALAISAARVNADCAITTSDGFSVTNLGLGNYNFSAGAGASGFRMVGNWGINWTSQSAGAVNIFAVSPDVGITRNAAGVIEINNGTAGTYRDLKVRGLTTTGQYGLSLGSGNNFVESPSSSVIRFLQADATTAADVDLRAGVFWGAGAIGATNYSRLKISHAGGTAGATIATEAGGTGTAGDITLSPGSNILKIGANHLFLTNGQYTCGDTLFIGNSNETQFNYNDTRVKSSYMFKWSSGTAGGTIDTALARNAAGVIEINNGTASSYAAIRAAAFENAQGTLTSGATIAWDVRAKQSAILTLGTNATLSNPTNMVAGTTYMLVVIQDGTGSRTLGYGTAYKWPGGAAPVLSTAAGSRDVLTFIYDGTYMLGVAQKAFS